MAGTLVAGTVLGLTAGTAAYVAVAFVTNLAISYVVSQMFAPDNTNGLRKNDGSRVQLPPATDNIIPQVYGTAWVRPTITDAKISLDQTTMWYVCSLSEAAQTNTIGDIYWNDNLVTFDGTDPTKVISFTDSTGTVDTSPDGNIYIYKFRRGSSSGQNTAQTAIQILQDAAIDPAFQWQATDTMTDTSFIIVKIIYSADKGFTGLANLNVQVTNPTTKPGDCMVDYLTNTVYGCSIPLSRINTASFTALNNYSDQTISYGITSLLRYRFNGVINPGTDCWDNLQKMAECCDSWLQWNETSGKWGVVINKAYDQAPNAQTLNDLFLINDNNVIGGITIMPTDLNSTFNGVDVQYYLGNNQDKQLYEYVDLNANLWNPNEPKNRQNINLELVNDNRTAAYIGVRRMLTSREDLVIELAVDWSGIQIDAGDVVRVTNTKYGWTNKLFRVSQVVEEREEQGVLGAKLTLVEYNGTIYNDYAINNYAPSSNTGITNPQIALPPTQPIITNVLPYASIPNYTVSTTIPATGLYNRVEFWQAPVVGGVTGTYSLLYTDVSSNYYTNGQTVSTVIQNVPDGSYTIKARVVTTGGIYSAFSSSSPVLEWTPANSAQTTSIDFTRTDTGLLSTAVLETIVYGNRFVMIGDEWGAPYTDYFYYSDDGTTWTAGTLPASWTSLAVAGAQLAWNGSQYLAYAYSSNGIAPGMTSTDGINWTYQPSYQAAFGVGAYASNHVWAAGRWVVNGRSGGFATSTDGITWVDLYTPTATAGGQGGIHWGSIVYSGGTFYAVGERVSNYPVVIKSTDGLNWSFHTTINIPQLYFGNVYQLTTNGTTWFGVGGVYGGGPPPYVGIQTTDFTTWTIVGNLFLDLGGNITNPIEILWDSVNSRWICLGKSNNAPEAAISNDLVNWVEERSIKLLPGPINAGIVRNGQVWVIGSRQPTHTTTPAFVAKSLQ